MDFSVVQSHPDLLLYVDKLQRENAESLAFYPRQVFERESEKGRLFLGLLNGSPAGYIYVGSASVNLPIHQACIEYDARRSLYGSMLVTAVEDYAVRHGVSQITLRCGFDLDANNFWHALGYRCISVVDGGVRRMRRINVWRKYLQPNLFADFSIDPERGKTDASVWAKYKQPGVVTQFVRGEAMAQYRELIQRGNQIGTEPLPVALETAAD